MKITWLGTATVLIEMAGVRLLTDPAFDPIGTRYDFGPGFTPASWFASERTYETPMRPAEVGAIDAVLLTHDHHADNCDPTGRELLRTSQVARVVTVPAAAARLSRAASVAGQPGQGLGIGDKTTALAWGASTTVGGVRITATPARHGPRGTPQIHEVAGFLLEADGAPTVWISGDTVLFPALREVLETLKGRVDVAIVHCGGVSFPKVPLIGRSLFTFDAAQVVEVCRILEPRTLIPVHRSGWAHFREPEDALRETLLREWSAERTRWLELGETYATT